jgi:acetylornithine deacetylase
MDVADYHGELRELAAGLVGFESTAGNEAPAQDWLAGRLETLGFETYRWRADAEALSDHSSFPDDPDDIPTADRPSVAGVLELGDPDAGPTLVLNGHVDVVPASLASGSSSRAERSDGVPADDELWSSDPFEPSWEDGHLRGRGATDMKAPLAACVVAARAVGDASETTDIDGRVVVESVAGEEDGGVGAAAAALSNPYPFVRDAAIIAEPTELAPVVATEGCFMARLHVTGRQAHAASPWRGVDAVDHFERFRAGLKDLERERHEQVTHPLYDGFPVRWPVVVGRVNAGDWASNVPANCTAEMRVGVAPGETVDAVEQVVRERLREVADADDWTREHPPRLERFTVQFEPGEIDPDEPVVGAVQEGMRAAGLPDTEPRGATYGADQRHYIAADIPTVLFGPGTVEQAHFPDESIAWADVETAATVLAAAARSYLGSGYR